MTKIDQTSYEIMQNLRSIRLDTERDSDFERLLHRKFQRDEGGQLSYLPVLSTENTETTGIAFIEGAGAGKTTAILRGLSRFKPLLHNSETNQPRYISVQVSSPATLKSLGIAILRKLEVPQVSPRATSHEIWTLIKHRMRVLGVYLIWIDEAHDLFNNGTNTEAHDMFKMLKSLMQGEHPVVVIISGTERLIDLTRLDPQIDRRFAKLKPAPLEVGVDTDDMEQVINSYASQANLKIGLPDDFMVRLFHASNYMLGRSIVCILDAIECALETGDSVLKIKHFIEAWGFQKGCSLEQNVFFAKDWQSLNDRNEDVDSPSNSRKRSRKRGR